MSRPDDELDWSCPICLDAYSQDVAPLLLPCQHSVCSVCVSSLGKMCPVCRSTFKTHLGVDKNLLRLIQLSNDSSSNVSLKKDNCVAHPQDNIRYHCLDHSTHICRQCRAPGDVHHSCEVMLIDQFATFGMQDLEKYAAGVIQIGRYKANENINDIVRISQQLQQFKAACEQYKTTLAEMKKEMHDKLKIRQELSSFDQKSGSKLDQLKQASAIEHQVKIFKNYQPSQTSVAVEDYRRLRSCLQSTSLKLTNVFAVVNDKIEQKRTVDGDNSSEYLELGDENRLEDMELAKSRHIGTWMRKSGNCAGGMEKCKSNPDWICFCGVPFCQADHGGWYCACLKSSNGYMWSCCKSLVNHSVSCFQATNMPVPPPAPPVQRVGAFSRAAGRR
eukprot:TRINITY_DN47692_c0_g1_i2.p1 TRINITY_DN47692_c0_g1~~TRINITY_DN47692_c0_g1_i2.p1  ORF type:complete len:388 (-),score=77.89 TRINITY_DN47692_c0_g1_i2:50-1213(-)